MDNTNMKIRPIRAEKTVLEQFKKLLKKFSNQSIALENLLNTYKMQKTKIKVVTQQIEIENLNNHLQAISSAFFKLH